MLQLFAVCDEEFFEIAKIISFFKTEGEIKVSSSVFSFSELNDILKKAPDIFIYKLEIFPKRVLVENTRIASNFLVVKLKNIDSRRNDILNSSLIVKKYFLEEFIIETNHFLRYLNYTVYDQESRILGKVKSFDNRGQNKLVLDNKKLIPFVESYIKEIDNKNNKLFLNIPEGFFDA